VSPHSLPNLIPPAPSQAHNIAEPLETSIVEEEDGLTLSQALQQATRAAYEDCLHGRQSSIEGDSS
jgi:hypothetical protein